MIDEDDMAIPEAQLQTWSHQGSVTQSSRPKPVDYFETRARLRNEFVKLRIVMPIRPRRSSMTFGRSPLPSPCSRGTLPFPLSLDPTPEFHGRSDALNVPL